jgi:DNA repair exonuclease SbcCD ATPase subunit
VHRDEEGGGVTADNIADSIRQTMRALDAKYRQIQRQHQEAEQQSGRLENAIQEAIQQQREAISKNNLFEARKLEQAIKSMDAERHRQEAIKSKVERDAGVCRTEYARLEKALRTPPSIPYECPGCGATLTPTMPRKLAKGRRGATYDCAVCDVIYSVSWGAAGDDMSVEAA